MFHDPACVGAWGGGLFTAMSVRAPSIQMNVMHLAENGQNGSGWSPA